ncbi:MAG TPA: HAD hydrolase-like protein [Micromonosporaceae bacterium]|nr:HAD hydrolase-like protein [Micromonosporaceae bacterium]
MRRLTVGFDLDMTLIDSRPGIAACYRALTEQTGVYVDAELAVSRLGPPLRQEIAEWFPPDDIESAVATFRELYPAHAIAGSPVLPGAASAVAAVRALGGRVIVVTSKIARLARLHLAHVGLTADEVVGERFADGKTAALAEHDVAIYVGDHTADVRAARAAAAVAVGVATGPCTVDELTAAGAGVVLTDLTGFAGWLAQNRRRFGLGRPASVTSLGGRATGALPEGHGRG